MAQLKSKKRSLPSTDTGEPRKKIPKVEQSPVVDKKRKQPITQPEASSSHSDDAGDYDEGLPDEVAPGVGENGVPEKKPRMTKAERAALHAAQPHRTALLPSAPLLQNTLLPLWETARRADLGKEERKKAVRELWEAVKGRVGEVSRGHKGGRVLQTVSDSQAWSRTEEGMCG